MSSSRRFSRRKSAISTTRRPSRRLSTTSRVSTRRSVYVNDDQQVDNPCTCAYTPCTCGPNFYQKVFGPTADESLLVGLQTVIALCEDCPKEETSATDSTQTLTEDERQRRATIRSPSMMDDTEDDRRRRSSFRASSVADGTEEDDDYEEDYVEEKPTQSSSDTQSDSSQTESCPAKSCCAQTADQRTNGGSQTDYNCTCNTCAQTQPPCVKAVCSQAGQCRCVSVQNSRSCLKPCCHVPKVCKSIQYSKSRCRSGSTRAKASSDSCCCCAGTESEASPVSCCYCSDPTSHSKSKSICPNKKSTLKRSSICSCCRSTTLRNTTSASSKRCTCSACKPKPPRQVTLCDCPLSTSSSGFEDTEEMGNCMEMGDRNEVSVRYAITKISRFFSYTTFEVMKSTSKKPKVMPKTLEGVFVLKNSSCND